MFFKYKKTNIFLIVILVISFLYRLIAINQSFWLDEAIQAWAVSHFNLFTLLKNYMPGDFNPPLSHVITFIFVKFFGSSELVLRLPSVLAGVGLVWVCYKFLSKILDPTKDSLLIKLGTVLISFSPLLFYYSQEARPYELAAFFVTWSMYEFYSCFIEKSKDYKPYILVTGLMFLSHYLTWFIWPIQFIYLIIFENSKDFKHKLVKLFAPLSFIFIIFPMLFSQLKSGLGAADNLEVWKNLSAFSLKQLALIPSKILLGRLNIDFNLPFTILILVFLLLYVIILLQKLNLKKPKQILKDNIFVLLSLWLIGPVLIGAILSLKLAIFTYFRFLYIAPAFYLLLIYSLQNLKKDKQYKFIFLFILLSFVSTNIYLINPNNHRENWKETVAFITRNNFSNNVVILSSMSRPFWYYDKDNHNLIDYPNIDKIIYEKYVWLVKYGQPIFDPENKTEKELESYGFQQLQQKNFRGDIIVKLMVNGSGFIVWD